MKFTYDLTDNYFKYYNEANGIVCLKKKLLKNPKQKIYSFWGYILYKLNPVIIISFWLIFVSKFLNNLFFLPIIYFVLIFICIIFCFLIIQFWVGYKSKFNSKQGTIEINEKGIKDININGNRLEFAYDNMELIVVTKNALVVTMDGPIILIFKKDNKKEVLEEIKKYSNVLIIDDKNNEKV